MDENKKEFLKYRTDKARETMEEVLLSILIGWFNKKLCSYR
ncbi:MAG: hypothetical protein QG635_1224 [Bacteroidota bacterium]|nr:hypothetical protein [Bacteroidota bacterium]